MSWSAVHSLSRAPFPAAPASASASPRHAPDVLDAADRLAFERMVQWLRVALVVTPGLVLAAFGTAALPQAVLIAVCVATSWGVTAALLGRWPSLLLRYQLGLRLFDAAIVALALNYVHAVHGATSLDYLYVLLVVNAAATHGRRGALLLAGVSGAAVAVGRAWLIAGGYLPFEPRLVADCLFLTLFFALVGYAVASLMRRSGDAIMRREVTWRAELAAHNSTLQEVLSARAQALAAAEQALKSRDAFVATVTHDLRGPLTTVKGYCHVLHEALSRSVLPNRERVDGSLAKIDRAANRMNHLISELLDAARVEAGQPLDLVRQPVDLAALVRQQVQEHQQVASEHQFRLSVPASTLVGTVDADRIERVLANLLSNATKYSPTGTTVDVSLDGQAGEQAAISVQDRGVGIPATDLPRVFERFHRGANVAGTFTGTGIGLSTARQIIEQHGGSITLQSEEGAGTTVTLRLPLS